MSTRVDYLAQSLRLATTFLLFGIQVEAFTLRPCYRRLEALHHDGFRLSWHRGSSALVLPSDLQPMNSLVRSTCKPGRSNVSPIRLPGIHMARESSQQNPTLDSDRVLDAIIEQLKSSQSGDFAATVEEHLDLCDHALLTHLRGKIVNAGESSEMGVELRKIEKEITLAMQRRLEDADANLRYVLDLAPDIKRMEGRLRSLFREGKLNMAFNVTIEVNKQRARDAEGAEGVFMLLTHVTEFISVLQEERLSSEVKLLRLLLRTDCDEVRKTLMRERLRMPHQDIFSEHPPIVDQVEVHLLNQVIEDLIQQVEDLDQATDVGLADSLRNLRVEINDVVEGYRRPGPFRR